MKSCIVIGSGIAGIAAAIRISKLGYDVSVFESNNTYGGKLDELTLGAYRFDKGPSLFTLPELVDKLFILCNEDPKKHFIYSPLNHSCKYFWDDGTEFKMHLNKEKLKNEFKSTFDSDYEKFESKLIKAKTTYNRIGKIFTDRPLQKISSWLKADVARALLYLPSYKLFTTMAEANHQDLKHHKLEQLFNRYATYNGSDPYQAPAILNMIPHLEQNLGTFFPSMGMRSIVTSLYELALRQGVKFNFNSKIKEITVSNHHCSGVKMNDQLIEADLIVSNVDVHYTYHNLLPKKYINHQLLRQERSSSAVIFYWAVNKSYPKIETHNILFSNDYKAEFEHLFKLKTCYNDPTVYIHVSSKQNKNDAPEGCENWFVMINAPATKEIDWTDRISTVRKHVIEKIKHTVDHGFESNINEEAVLTPSQIDENTASYLGSLYGTSSNSRYAAFRRQSNQHNKIKNLYFCGGSVHPGGGIPLCLKSAEIVSNLINIHDR